MTRHDFFELYTVVLGQLAHNAISYKTLTNIVVIIFFFSLRVHCVFVSRVYNTNNIKVYSVNDRQPITMQVNWPIIIDLSDQQPEFNTINWHDTTHFGSEVEYHARAWDNSPSTNNVWWNVSFVWSNPWMTIYFVRSFTLLMDQKFSFIEICHNKYL